jgi:thioesterase domain-containing protein/AcrR family transcriptional regulator/acyl carrier protein
VAFTYVVEGPGQGNGMLAWEFGKHRGSLGHGDAFDERVAREAIALLREGTGAVSLRAVAREAGVSAMAPYRHFADKEALLAALATRRKVAVNCTPSLWSAVLDALEAGRGVDPGDRLVRLFFSGEAPGERLIERTFDAFPHLEVWNMYGATETTGTSIAHRVTRADDVPIGCPIRGFEAHVLDDAGALVADGEVGELHLAGPSLALGYLGRPELTAETFVSVPGPAGGELRLYRTGDLVRRRADGNLVFVGRADRRVNVHGASVEPGEVEEALSRHPDVATSVVTGFEDSRGATRLAAYVVSAGERAPDAGELRRYLRSRLPPHMVPAAVVAVESLPLTHTGKVDRAALPPPPAPRKAERPPTGPETPVEHAVREMWERLLDVGPISVDDDFFALGGDSLLAMRLVTEIGRRFDRELPPAVVFEAPTVRSLAAAVEGPNAAWRSLVPLQAGGSRPPLFFVAPNAGNVVTFAELARSLGPAQPFYALQPQALDGDARPRARVEEMAAHYLAEVRRVQPGGPYLLGGLCYGGRVAFEMARQLAAAGEETALLALVEAPPALLPDHRVGIGAGGPRAYRENGSGRPGRDRRLPPRRPAPRSAPHPSHGLAWHLRFRLSRARKLARDRMTRLRGRTRRGTRTLARRARTAWLGARRLRAAERAALEAHAAYRARRYEGAAVVYLTEESLPWWDGWSELGDGIELDVVPGTHRTVVREPHVRTLAERLRARADGAARGARE